MMCVFFIFVIINCKNWTPCGLFAVMEKCVKLKRALELLMTCFCSPDNMSVRPDDEIMMRIEGKRVWSNWLWLFYFLLPLISFLSLCLSKVSRSISIPMSVQIMRSEGHWLIWRTQPVNLWLKLGQAVLEHCTVLIKFILAVSTASTMSSLNCLHVCIEYEDAACCLFLST